ncbi:MAG: UDP-2,4-diacetamido-2,4,6-trideoxy-beta-L-altropyranose hydrolase [Elusimicrobiota bacterium]
MPPEPPLLLLRADAGPGIGSGHVARLLALAEAWIDAGGRARLLTAAPSPALNIRAGLQGIEIVALSAAYPNPEDLATTTRAVRESASGTWLAIDGYGFDAAYLSALRAAGARVLRVDDGPSGEIPCDAFLDPNPGAELSAPNLASNALPLLGPRWAPMRSSFARAFERRPDRTQTMNLLISFGGWDPEDATGLALRALRRIKTPFEAVIVVGPDNPRADALAKLADGLPIRLERMADMATLMGKADLALIGGGVTMLEACAAGLPALVVTVAANQDAGAADLARRGLVRSLGRAAVLNEEPLARALDELLQNAPERDRMSREGRAAVDGRGAARVAAALLALSEPRLSADWARLRPAVAEDALEVWRIANDPAVRAHSFRKEPIQLADHLKWFEAQLKDADGRFWVVETGFVLAGQIRYARSGDQAEVHYSVRGAFRGKGLGTLALAQSHKLACRELGVKRLTGVVISPNEPSERSFASAGWTRMGGESRNGSPCAVFEVACS